jgi:type I restriction enzyme S subunit
MREGWTYKRLGDICTIERGGSPRPIDAFITTEDNGLNWIKIGDAVEGSKYISSTKEKIKPEGLKKTRFVHKGDFILSNSMSFGKPYILNIDGCIHDGWLVIHDENDTFDKSFLYYLLGSPNMYKEFKRLAVGGVVNNLNSKVVRDVIVPVPPLQEQERIVAELDLLTEIIDKQKQQLRELDTLAQSIFYNMFGNPEYNEKGWGVKTMGEIGSLQRGSGLSKKDLVEEGFPCILYGQIHTKFGAYAERNIAFIPEDLVHTAKIAHSGDLVMALTSEDVEGSCKSVAWLGNYDVAVGSDAAIFSHSENGIYLSYYTQTRAFYNEKAKYARGFKVTHISTKDIATIPVMIPPRLLQDEFALKVQFIEKQKESINRSLAESQKLFDYTMDKYFG